jgi:type VI secretion system protein VasD
MNVIRKAGRWTRRAVTGRILGLLGLGLVAPLALSACASAPPPPPPPTTVVLSINADNTVNLDPSGQPAPVQVHVYWLRAATAIQSGDFFQLTEQPEAALGQELSAHQQMIVRPGQGVSIQRTAQTGETYVGVVAAYRDLDNAVWRSVARLQPNTQNVINVQMGQRGLTLTTGTTPSARLVTEQGSPAG